MTQIQQTYSATWTDLINICQIKAGFVYWPVMEKAFTDCRLSNTIDYDSGVHFCEQLYVWAKDKLADQTHTIQDISQDKEETVEKYHAKMCQAFEDLGFTRYERSHTQMLAAAFVNGLREDIRKGLLVARPEYRSMALSDLLLVAKGLESQRPRKPATAMMTVTQDAIAYGANPDPTYSRPPPLPSARANVICFNCAKKGHYKRECRAPKRRQDGDTGDKRDYVEQRANSR